MYRQWDILLRPVSKPRNARAARRAGRGRRRVRLAGGLRRLIARRRGAQADAPE
jgi:hypothetical protein